MELAPQVPARAGRVPQDVELVGLSAVVRVQRPYRVAGAIMLAVASRNPFYENRALSCGWLGTASGMPGCTAVFRNGNFS